MLHFCTKSLLPSFKPIDRPTLAMCCRLCRSFGSRLSTPIFLLAYCVTTFIDLTRRSQFLKSIRSNPLTLSGLGYFSNCMFIYIICFLFLWYTHDVVFSKLLDQMHREISYLHSNEHIWNSDAILMALDTFIKNSSQLYVR